MGASGVDACEEGEQEQELTQPVSEAEEDEGGSSRWGRKSGD